MRRAFWVAVGLGAGAVGAVMTMRFARTQAQRIAPANLAREARGGLMDLAKLVSESLSEGQRAMQERQDELRGELAEPR